MFLTPLERGEERTFCSCCLATSALDCAAQDSATSMFETVTIASIYVYNTLFNHDTGRSYDVGTRYETKTALY
jgi:hypothetical protein